MRAYALLLIAALAFAGCTTKDDAGPDGSGGDTTNDTAPVGMAATPLSVALVDRQVPPGVGVPPRTMGIDPSSLAVKVGERVNLTITNNGNTGHDLVIEAFGIDTDTLAPGDSVSVEFTPTEAGTFKMYCSIGGSGPTGHDAQGMNGEVVVS